MRREEQGERSWGRGARRESSERGARRGASRGKRRERNREIGTSRDKHGERSRAGMQEKNRRKDVQGEINKVIRAAAKSGRE